MPKHFRPFGYQYIFNFDRQFRCYCTIWHVFNIDTLFVPVDCHHAEKARTVDGGCQWNGAVIGSESQGYFDII